MPASQPSQQEPSVWTPATQWVLASLIALTLALATWHSLGRSPWSVADMPLRKGVVPVAPLPLNSATAEQLATIPGLGPALARRIVAHREAHGPFPDIDALEVVRGIGPKILARIRPFLLVEPSPSAPPLVRAARPDEPPDTKAKPPPLEPINLNTATETELRALPGVGPVLASRILEARKRGPFVSVDDLRFVRGIGDKTLQRLRPYVFVVATPR